MSQCPRDESQRAGAVRKGEQGRSGAIQERDRAFEWRIGSTLSAFEPSSFSLLHYSFDVAETKFAIKGRPSLAPSSTAWSPKAARHLNRITVAHKAVSLAFARTHEPLQRMLSRIPGHHCLASLGSIWCSQYPFISGTASVPFGASLIPHSIRPPEKVDMASCHMRAPLGTIYSWSK
jgi:hypothetical protein